MVNNYESFFHSLVRRKPIETGSSSSHLKRCLTTFDLTFLSIGSTLGLGMYVIAGQVASQTAGPAVVLSFLFAAIASFFSGLCYAEFGARVPKAGSAYVYSYVTVGEFVAFIIGWNLILEYVIGTASVARGYSGYLDSLINNTLSTTFKQWMPMNIEHMSSYPDLFALTITLLLSIMLAFGVKESSRFTSIFTLINLSIVIFVITVGSFKVDITNWQLTNSTGQLPPKAGDGGFFPFGISGALAGAATCFYSFVGFDIIATTGEEVKNPQKSIPISIILSLTIIFIAYLGVSSIQTLIWPYYDLNQAAPLPYVFERVGFNFAKYLITVGALAGLSTALIGAMFPLPRILYAMANDGLLFRSLANVNVNTKTPLLATFISGVFAAIMAAIFDVTELADMMSIGTLLAYTLVSVAILLLRHENIHQETVNRHLTVKHEIDDHIAISQSTTPLNNCIQKRYGCVSRVFNGKQIARPNKETTKTSKFLIAIICVNICILNFFIIYYEKELAHLDGLPLICTILLIVLLIVQSIGLTLQPRAEATISFQVPLVPLIPILSIFINTYLMMKLPSMTWYRFAIWMFIGLANYFCYGIRKSTGYLQASQLDEKKVDL